MNKIIIVILTLLLSACASISPPQKANEFIIEFGHIVEVGEFFEIRPHQGDIYVEPGDSTPKFGVRIENLSKVDFTLAFYIERFNEDSSSFETFTQGGYWNITAPKHEQHEAFIWERDKVYSPGKYKFGVIADSKTIRIIEFNIVEMKG